MEALDQLKLSQLAKREGWIDFPATPDKKPTLPRSLRAVPTPIDRTERDSRLPGDSDRATKIGINAQIDADFRFLKSNVASPFAVRLALELAEAVRAITQDPVAFMRAIVESRANSHDGLGILAKKPQLVRSLRAVPNPAVLTERDARVEIDAQTYAEFRFLKSSAAVPFPVRLANELAEAVKAIKQDPLALIRANSESGPIPHEKRKRMRVGIAAAVAFYGLVLSGIYASYAISHRAAPAAQPVKHLVLTYLASPPMPVKKLAPLFKEAGGRTSKDQLAAPIRPAEQPKAELLEAKPTPPPPDHTLTRTEPTTQTSNSPTSETASRSASDGAARGLTGNGVGTASDSGRGSGSGAEVNYNDVFTISKVTTRPQILARPVPGYTEEARRAQVEGAVKLSVVLNANGTVSEITVARALGYGLDQKAIEAARELRFVPAQKDGHTVSVRVFLEFKFSLL